jgi:hypothetical protein
MSRSLTPQNPLSTNTISVSSANGFSAGDLVYQKSGDVGLIPTGTVASASFNVSSSVTQTAGILPNTARALGVSFGNGGSTQVSPSAAKLTNGNMVVVWVSAFSGSSAANFRIINEAGTEVVATTSMGTGNNGQPLIAVAALTGGGFAAAWTSGAATLVYAIYSNTGTVVTSATSEGAIGVSNSSITVAARPDGSFIVAVNDTSASQARFKIYSATGVQVVAWTNIVAYIAARARTAVAVRSDNSFVIGAYTSATNIQYYVYNSAGASTSNATLISASNANSSNGHLDMATLTNNSVVFIYLNASNFPTQRILNSSNSFILDTVVAGSTSYTCSVGALSGGGYVATWDTGNSRYLIYAFYNATGGSLSGDRNNFSATPSTTSQNGSYYTTVVEMASNVAFITATSTTLLSMTQANTSTYAMRNFTSATQVVSTATANVSGYARATSTPNAAAFLAASNETLTSSFSTSAAITATQVSNIQVQDIKTCVMPNGDIVIATTGTNPYTVTFYVYNSIGTILKNTILVFTGDSGGLYCSMCVLTNGNLVVAYNGNAAGNTSSGTISAKIYNSSYALQSTTVLTSGGNNLASGATYTFGVSAMINNRFVAGWWDNSNGPIARVFNSDATVYSSLVAPAGTNEVGTAVAGTADGGFVIRYNRGGVTGVGITWYKNTSGATYSSTGSNNYSTTAQTSVYNSQVAVATNGTVLSFYLDSSTNSFPMIMDSNGNQTNISSFNPATVSPRGIYAMCTMPNNNFTVLKLDSSSGGSGQYVFAVVGAGSGASISPIVGPIAITFPALTPMQYQSANGPIPSMCATFDNQTVVAYLNTSQYPCFFILNTTTATYTTAITGGTTASLPAYYPSQSNGHVLKGVATTTAIAGGSGIVQNIGSAQLNSQYPASTTYQSFDSTGTLIQGTRGTITGRNVNMTGTS